MKRQYYRTTHSGGGVLFSSVGRLVTALVALAVFALLIFRLAAPGAFITLVSPAFSIGQSLTGAVGGASPFQGRAAIVKERDAYAAQVSMLENQNAVLASRVADLERLLGGRTEAGPGHVAAVLARPPVSPYDMLVVDQGSSAGVRIGSHAFGPGGIPLGTVTEANANSSRITLYSATGQVTEGWVGPSHIPMKLTGTGGGGFDAEIPGTLGALVGDAVYVPGPGALPIGSITEVVTDPSSPSVVLRIRPTINVFTITWVTIAP